MCVQGEAKSRESRNQLNIYKPRPEKPKYLSLHRLFPKISKYEYLHIAFQTQQNFHNFSYSLRERTRPHLRTFNGKFCSFVFVCAISIFELICVNGVYHQHQTNCVEKCFVVLLCRVQESCVFLVCLSRLFLLS